MTVQILFNRAWQMHWSQERYRKSGWAKEVQGLYDRHLHGAFGHLDARKVKISDVRIFHRSLAAKPVTANRCLEVLGRVYTLAEEFEILPQGSNPCRLVRAYGERKRTRYATRAEIHRVSALLALYKPRFPLEVAFIRLLMLTGARPRSIARARRDELEVVEGMAFLRFDGKTTVATGEDEVVAIPDKAMREVVDPLPIRGDGLLIGDVKYRNFWQKIQVEASCQDLWIRDWRRTFATVGLSTGVNLAVIGELLNHQSTQTTKTYAKLLPGARHAAVAQIASEIQSY